jgi:hypothetical protein
LDHSLCEQALRGRRIVRAGAKAPRCVLSSPGLGADQVSRDFGAARATAGTSRRCPATRRSPWPARALLCAVEAPGWPRADRARAWASARSPVSPELLNNDGRDGGVNPSCFRRDRQRWRVPGWIAKLKRRVHRRGRDEGLAGDQAGAGSAPIHRVGQFDHATPGIKANRQLARLVNGHRESHPISAHPGQHEFGRASSGDDAAGWTVLGEFDRYAGSHGRGVVRRHEGVELGVRGQSRRPLRPSRSSRTFRPVGSGVARRPFGPFSACRAFRPRFARRPFGTFSADGPFRPGFACKSSRAFSASGAFWPRQTRKPPGTFNAFSAHQSGKPSSTFYAWRALRSSQSGEAGRSK